MLVIVWLWKLLNLSNICLNISFYFFHLYIVSSRSSAFCIHFIFCWFISNILIRSFSLHSSFISYLFYIFIIVLFNIMRLRSCNTLIYLFFGFSKNSEPVIIHTIRYGIIQLYTILYFELDSIFIQCKTPIYIIWNALLLFSSLVLSFCIFLWNFLS